MSCSCALVQCCNINLEAAVERSPTLRLCRAIAEIVSAMGRAVKEGRDVNLNALKNEISKKFSLARAPKLVEVRRALARTQRAQRGPWLSRPPPATGAIVPCRSSPLCLTSIGRCWCPN